MNFSRRLSLRVNMTMALALVPPDDVEETFEMLLDDLPADVPLQEFMDYVRRTYVGGFYVLENGRGRGRGGARAGRERIVPTYPIELWNQYDAAVRGESKTNNASEGWHNRFHIMVSKDHPDLYSALTEIQNEQSDTEISVIETTMGRAVRCPPSRRWVEFQNRIQNIVGDYQERKEDDEVLDYLRTLAYNIVL